MTLTREQVIELHKQDCQFLMYGACTTRACFVRAGYQEGPTAGFEPTCPYRQAVETDAALRQQLDDERQAHNNALDIRNALNDSEMKKLRQQLEELKHQNMHLLTHTICSQSDQLRTELAAVREERDKLKDWNERQAKMLSSERGTLNDCKQRTVSLKQQLADLQGKLSDVERELDRSNYENAHANEATRQTLIAGIQERDIKLQQLQRQLNEAKRT